MNQKDLARFMRKVIALPSPVGIKGPCWIWTGCTKEKGYGRFRLGKKITAARRVAFEHFKRKLKSGEVVHHRCENRDCVNPKHLEACTVIENNKYVNAGRRRQSEKTRAA